MILLSGEGIANKGGMFGILYLLGLVCLLSVSQIYAQATDIRADAEVDPGASDNFYEAKCRLWISESTYKIEGILIVLHGTDSDARGIVEKTEWQDFAEKESIALVGVFFRGEGEPYEDASKGSGVALLRMIDQIADRVHRAELKNAPLFFVGHSAGAMFSYNFACWMPKRTGAFVSVKSGPISPITDSIAGSIPGLFIVGENDLPSRVRTTAEVFAKQRNPDKAWAFALEPGGGHGSNPQIAGFVKTFLREIIALYRENVDGMDSVRRFLPQTGNISNLQYPYNPGQFENENDQVWLPGPESLEAWQLLTKATSIGQIVTKGGREPTVPTSEFNPAQFNLGILHSTDDFAKVTQIVRLNAISHEVDCAFFSKDPHLSVVSKKLNEGEFEVTIGVSTSELKGGWFHSSVQCIIQRNGQMRQSSIPVIAKIISALEPSPSSIYVGVLPRGTVIEKSIRIKLSSGKAIKAVETLASKPDFAKNISSSITNDSAEIRVQFDGRNTLGNQSGYLDVFCGDSGREQIRIPFIAWVSKE